MKNLIPYQTSSISTRCLEFYNGYQINKNRKLLSDLELLLGQYGLSLSTPIKEMPSILGPSIYFESSMQELNAPVLTWEAACEIIQDNSQTAYITEINTLRGEMQRERFIKFEEIDIFGYFSVVENAEHTFNDIIFFFPIWRI